MKKAVGSHNKILAAGLKIGLLLIVSAMLLGIGYCGYQVHNYSNRQEAIKKDYMLINSVSFGLVVGG
ncbi:MAG: hypothetical protein WDM78_05110 [Puia sp.]